MDRALAVVTRTAYVELSSGRVYAPSEWRAWKTVGDPVLHIDLRRWADVLLIAPLSANTLAKLANGMCDNLLTCVVGPGRYPKP